MISALKNWLKGGAFALLVFAAVAGVFLKGLSVTEKNSSEEETRVLTESLNRAVITCYSIEGSYPQSLKYLTDNYGISINEDKYVVYYDIFASNIMPEITVIER